MSSNLRPPALSLEVFHDLERGVRKSDKRWNNRLVLEGNPLAELYSECRLNVALELEAKPGDIKAWCQERGKEPEKPYSGHLTLRVPPEIHRSAAVAAVRAHQSLNAWIADQIIHAAAA